VAKDMQRNSHVVTLSILAAQLKSNRTLLLDLLNQIGTGLSPPPGETSAALTALAVLAVLDLPFEAFEADFCFS